jgi:hypothetical protein
MHWGYEKAEVGLSTGNIVNDSTISEQIQTHSPTMLLFLSHSDTGFHHPHILSALVRVLLYTLHKTTKCLILIYLLISKFDNTNPFLEQLRHDVASNQANQTPFIVVNLRVYFLLPLQG